MRRSAPVANLGYLREVAGRTAEIEPRMKTVVILAVLVTFGLAVASSLPALAQASIVDTQLEVSTAVAQSSITTEAIKKADDTKCRAYQARIDTLTGQVKAGKAQRADLIAAREALIGRLGEIDGA